MLLMDIIKQQETMGNTRSSNWTEFNSKKQLKSNCTILTEDVINTLCMLKNTFTFNVHNSGQYVVITMYYSSTKSYGFLVVNTNTMEVVEMDSIKNSKQWVAQQLQNNTSNK